jgi:molybdenum cofactor synthesis domain-containing protein
MNRRRKRQAGIVIASTRAAMGIYEDHSAPVIASWLEEQGFDVISPQIVADGPDVGEALVRLLAVDLAVIITSGGTGLSQDDTTPEETLPLLCREVPGIMEAIRSAGMAKTPYASLGRGHAGVAGTTFVVNLPGSVSGVKDGLTVLGPILGHLCDQVSSNNGH